MADKQLAGWIDQLTASGDGLLLDLPLLRQVKTAVNSEAYAAAMGRPSSSSSRET